MKALNEFKHEDFISISTPVNSLDHGLFTEVVNKGIDSHLEAFVNSKFFYDCGRYYFHFHCSEKHILLRRLEEMALNNYDDQQEQIENWVEDIKNYDELVS